MTKNKEKVPSLFSLMNCLSRNYISCSLFINLFKNKGCGPTENRTRDLRKLNYLNLNHN
jgi:hypothetical protein